MALALAMSIPVLGQVDAIIPSSNRVDWIPGTTVGVFGGIPINRTIFTTVPAGASVLQINDAIKACPLNQVVKLSAGNYQIDGVVSLKSGVTLRGAAKPVRGSNPTVFNIVSGGTISSTGDGNVTEASANIFSGYKKGSTNLTLIAGGPQVKAGNFLLLFQDNDPALVQVYSGATNKMTVDHVRVISVTSGTNINFWPPLAYSFDASLTPRYRVKTGQYIEYAGLEDLMLAPDASINYVVYRAHAFSCWSKNVVITNIPNIGFYEFASLQCEQRHCDVFGSVSPSDGYGTEADVTSDNWEGCRSLWMEDCIYDGLYHGVVASGHVGCVVSYCFSTNEHSRTGITFPTASFNAAHSAGGRMDLWEGNWGSSYFTTDLIHGNTTHQVLWRNRFVGAANAVTSQNAHMPMLWLGRGSYWYSAVGNVLGAASWSPTNPLRYVYEYTGPTWDAASGSDNGGIYMLGYASYKQPLDPKTVSTFLRYQNYDFFHQSFTTETTIISQPTIDNSLIYQSRPAFFGSLPWPPIDNKSPNVAPDVVPAAYRYIHGIDPTDALTGPSTFRPSL
jgi:hypothetical protein